MAIESFVCDYSIPIRIGFTISISLNEENKRLNHRFAKLALKFKYTYDRLLTDRLVNPVGKVLLKGNELSALNIVETFVIDVGEFLLFS